MLAHNVNCCPLKKEPSCEICTKKRNSVLLAQLLLQNAVVQKIIHAWHILFLVYLKVKYLFLLVHNVVRSSLRVRGNSALSSIF